MRKSFFLVLVVALIAIVALAGCGGGGGGTDSPGPISTQRVISGKVVSTASGSPGISGVVVKLGDGKSSANIANATTTTDKDGNFSFTIDSVTAGIPAYVQIDVTGAGSNYAQKFPIGYNGGTYSPTYITIPVGVRNDLTDDLGTFKVADLSGDTPPWVPYPISNTILTGRIVRKDNGDGIPGVTVSFGVPEYTAVTGKNGYFDINLGSETSVGILLPGDKVFAIDTSTAGSEYPASLLVTYQGITPDQSNIPVPYTMYNGDGDTDFGVIYVNVSSGSGSGGSGSITPPNPPEIFF